MTDSEKINGWTFEETVKTAENLMEVEKNMFKWDVLRHLRDFAENYKEEVQKYKELGTVEELRIAKEKQTPKKPKHTLIKHGKHTWRKKENGEVDDFAWDFEYHNGVACEVCGETVCVHCSPEYDELTDCEEEYWNCPSCGKKTYSKSKCCDCGQKLNWESDTE